MPLNLSRPVPNNYGISSNFGRRTHPITKEKGSMHNGIDFAVSVGTPIVSACDCVVHYMGFDKFASRGVRSFGLYLKTRARIDGEDYFVYYAHLKMIHSTLNPGSVIERGQPIAESGGQKKHHETENDIWHRGSSTGPHLHFGVKTYVGPVGTWQDLRRWCAFPC